MHHRRVSQPRHLPLLRSEPPAVDRMAQYVPHLERPAGFDLKSLADREGRHYSYLRLSVTDRCDFRCEYCMPEAGEAQHERRADLLTFGEIERLVGIFELLGVRRLRFTGGEPFVRRDFIQLVERIAAAFPQLALALTTNGGRLQQHVPQLRAAGLESINVSIDSLNDERFARITRGGELHKVRAGIEAAAIAGLSVKLNIVPMRGINEDEWAPLVEYAWSLGALPRFIELMPLGEGKKVEERRVGSDEVMAALGLHPAQGVLGGKAHGPARYVEGSGGRVGFISPLSHNFCDSCNRLRINARGDIRACLADRTAVSLRDVIRSGGNDADVGWALQQALGAKKVGHAFNDLLEREHENVGMSLIGG
jgi:cyclic pyranopterin phosphate synthase